MNPVLPPLGETRKETVSQGGGVSGSLSGGDEQSEPESAICPVSQLRVTQPTLLRVLRRQRRGLGHGNFTIFSVAIHFHLFTQTASRLSRYSLAFSRISLLMQYHFERRILSAEPTSSFSTNLAASRPIKVPMARSVLRSYLPRSANRNSKDSDFHQLAMTRAQGSIASKNAFQLFLGSLSAFVMVTPLNLTPCSSSKNRLIRDKTLQSPCGAESQLVKSPLKCFRLMG